MKSFKYKLAIVFPFLTAFFATSLSNASSLDLNFHDDTTRLSYNSYTARDVVTDGGILFVSNNNSSEQLFHLGISKISKNVGFGIRGIYTSPGSIDLAAISLAVNARFYLSAKTHLEIGGYHAPEFTSFMDAAGYTEIGFRLSFNITEPLDIYIGYRNLKLKVENANNKIEMDDDFHLGLKFHF